MEEYLDNFSSLYEGLFQLDTALEIEDGEVQKLGEFFFYHKKTDREARIVFKQFG